MSNETKPEKEEAETSPSKHREEHPTRRMTAEELMVGDAAMPFIQAGLEKLDPEGYLLLRWGTLTALAEQINIARERNATAAVVDRMDVLVQMLRRMPWEI